MEKEAQPHSGWIAPWTTTATRGCVVPVGRKRPRAARSKTSLYPLTTNGLIYTLSFSSTPRHLLEKLQRSSRCSLCHTHVQVVENVDRVGRHRDVPSLAEPVKKTSKTADTGTQRFHAPPRSQSVQNFGCTCKKSGCRCRRCANEFPKLTCPSAPFRCLCLLPGLWHQRRCQT